MAEVETSLVRALARTRETPGRTRNRHRRYEQRRADARSTGDLLTAAADYFRATFAGHSPEEVLGVCNRLVEYTDVERRRVDGSQ